MPKKKVGCLQIFRVAEETAGNSVEVSREKIAFTGMRLVVAVAVTGIGTSVKHREFSRPVFGKDAHGIPRDPVQKDFIVLFGKQFPALGKLLLIFFLIFAADIMFGMGKPMFPITADSRSLIFFKDLKHVQNRLRQI